MPLFDAYVFVDWSAGNGFTSPTPQANAVWVGEFVPSHRRPPITSYHRSRYSAANQVNAFLHNCIKQERRVLVGFDFPYGYPSGLTAALGLNVSPTAPAPWNMIWSILNASITDRNNVNNRFQVADNLNRQINQHSAGMQQNAGQAGPFWGCPTRQVTRYLSVSSPGFPFHTSKGVQLNRLRVTESKISGVQETWKLFGAGSVGSQALVGIPYVYNLRYDPQLHKLSIVWPFETGFTPAPAPSKGPFVLHAEIWPGIVKHEVASLLETDRSMFVDQAQVFAMCQWAANQDANGTLARFFDVPICLSQTQVVACTREEGWILGV